MSLNTLGYLAITFLFAVIFIGAYCLRHKNKTYQDFLRGREPVLDVAYWVGDLGLLELTFLAMLTATYGFNFIYYTLLIYLLIHFFVLKYTRQGNQQSYAIISSCIKIFACLVVSGLAMLITFKLLSALLNWSFVNSLFGVVLFSIIYILIGGKTAITRSRYLCCLIVLSIILTTLIRALYVNHGVASLLHNLKSIAVSQGLTINYYSKIYFDKHWLLIAISLCFVCFTFCLINNSFSKVSNTKEDITAASKPPVLVLRAIILVLMLLPGLIALATQLGSFKSGSEIITYQAELPGGGVGYVVRAINKDTTQLNSVVNLIPQTINSTSNQLETNKYNYILAAVVYFRHYLGNSMSFMVVLLILSLFIYSVSHYLISGVEEFIYGIMLPGRFACLYGAAGLLWLSRLALVVFAFCALLLAWVLMRQFNLLEYITLFAIIFSLLTIAVSIYDQTKKK